MHPAFFFIEEHHPKSSYPPSYPLNSCLLSSPVPSLHPNPVTSMQTPIFPYPSLRQSHPSPSFLLCNRVSTITHASMRASLLQWLGNGQQPSSLPFLTGLAGVAIGVRRCCFGSGHFSLGCRRRPARRPLRLLLRRGRRRHLRRRPLAGAVASKAMQLHRLGAAAPAPLLYVVAGGSLA